MTMKKDTNQRIEDILNSLDNSKKASAPDFFYTRLKARMDKESTVRRPVWILRPAFALVAVVLVLIVNVAILVRNQQKSDYIPLADTEKFQSIASEYSLNDNT